MILNIMMSVFVTFCTPVRCDLTAQRAYSLSAHTIKLFESVESTVEITWFYSTDVDRYIPTVIYVRDLLKEYAHQLSKQCAVAMKDINLLSQSLRKELGFVARRVTYTRNTASIAYDAYSAILVEYRGMARAVPFVSDTKRLEYDIARLIIQMQQEMSADMMSRGIYVLAPPESLSTTYAHVLPRLQSEGLLPEILSISLPQLDTRIPLLILGSGYVDEHAVTLLDAFLQKGGNALCFVSGNSVQLNDQWTVEEKRHDFLINLLSTYGITINSDLILDEQSFAVSLPSVYETQYDRVSYPFWPVVTLKPYTHGVPVMVQAGIQFLRLFWPSSIRVSFPARVFESTSNHSLCMTAPFNIDPSVDHLKDLAKGKMPAPQAFVAFRDYPGKLMVVSDEYMVSAIVEHTHNGENLDFMINCIQWLCGNDGLLMLKSKNPAWLPLKSFRDEQKFARIVHRARYLNIVAIPVLIGMLFVVMQILYRRKR
ncbi:GldG family protein [Treponema pallidum]|nr:GldG family protein [Treponema pallidum]ANA42554.1 GldG domain protein [Treponema pallidum subsp. pallidum]QUJ41905.2 GldG family protein [Treponema pallidum]QUJ95835.2 GldG family protein [Treponema pallidum]QUK41662.2 GldG family protein [Treponema pallidum]QUK43590.2 GldG family protein [Treponema pallidum]